MTATLLRAAGLVLTLVINGILARTLSPADFGRFALLTSLLLILCCIARFGLERTIVRFAAAALTANSLSRYRGSFAKGYLIAFLTTMAVVSIWLAVASWNSVSLVGFELSSQAVVCMAVMIACGSFLMIASESFRVTHHATLANMSMAETSSVVIASLHLAFIGFVCWSYGNSLERSLMSLMLAMLIPSLIALAFLKRAIERAQPTPDCSKQDEPGLSFRSLLGAGGMAMLIQTVTNLTLTSDLWFVERYCSPDDLGRFAAAKRLVNLSAIPMSVISASAAAYIAILYAEGKKGELQSLLRKLVLMGASPSILFLMGCVFLPTWLLQGYYGESYGASSPILMILTVGYFFLAIVGAAEMSLVMTGHLRVTLLISVTAFLSLVVGCVVFSSYGTSAIAWVSSVVLGIRSMAMCCSFGWMSGTWTYLRLPTKT